MLILFRLNVGGIYLRCRPDEPYARAVTLVPGNPIKFDTGYVEHPRLIIIQNITKWAGRTNPSVEVAEKYAKSIILIRIGGEAKMSLAPGQAQPFWVCPGNDLPALLSIEGTTDVSRIRMHTFPGGRTE